MRNNNMRVFQRAVVIAIVVLMAITTTVSFAFWKSGVTGANKDTGLNVTIGAGIAANGTIDIKNINQTEGKLVPVQRAGEYSDLGDGSDASKYVTSITYTFDVAWITDTDPQTNTYHGTMNIELLAITVGGYDVQNYKSKFEDLSLFTVDKTFVSAVTAQYEGGTQSSVITYQTVTITITLNEPENSATYNLIASNSLNFAFRVTVDSASEQ